MFSTPRSPSWSSTSWPTRSAACGRCTEAGLSAVRATELTVRARYATFESWWEPYTLGVGPAGAYVASLSPERVTALRDQCRRLFPATPAELSATAWAVTARA
jgi:hypothetical protein